MQSWEPETVNRKGGSLQVTKGLEASLALEVRGL
jgi:hypothetical protein